MIKVKEKMKRLTSDIWKTVLKKQSGMEIKDIGIITITEKVWEIVAIDWLNFNDDEQGEYLNRDLEYTDKG